MTETERVRRIWEKLAPKYDKLIKFPERWLFAGGRVQRQYFLTPKRQNF